MFQQLKETIVQYIQLRLEELKLGAVERVGSVLGYLLYILITFFLSSLALFFIGLGVAFWLSNQLGNKLLGFFATAGIFVLIIVILSLIRRPLKRIIVGKLAREITSSDKKRKQLKK